MRTSLALLPALVEVLFAQFAVAGATLGRRKRGLSVPIAAWINGGLRERLEQH